MDRERSGGRGDRHRHRTRARAWTLQILYRWEAEGRRASLGEVMSRTFATRTVAPRRVPYVRRLVETLDEHLPEVDRALDRALENWRLERLSRVDRSVLRIAAAEVLFLDDIPPRVSIQEALGLADRYGGDESARFVNGVLDALFKASETGR